LSQISVSPRSPISAGSSSIDVPSRYSDCNFGKPAHRSRHRLERRVDDVERLQILALADLLGERLDLRARQVEIGEPLQLRDGFSESQWRCRRESSESRVTSAAFASASFIPTACRPSSGITDV